jgi:Tfp pilus assembly protein FimT
MKCLKRQRFTIMELMGVLIIMGLMMGIFLGSDAWRNSAGVDIGAQMISTQVRLARQYAITHRKRVAILLPNEDFNQTWDDSDNNASDMTYRANSFRSCFVDASDVFQGYIPNTEWTYLPITTVVESTTNATTATGAKFPKSTPSTFETADVRAIIFKPDGSLTSTSNVTITIARGVVVGTSFVRAEGAQNVITCTINWLTGAITFSKDE